MRAFIAGHRGMIGSNIATLLRGHGNVLADLKDGWDVRGPLHGFKWDTLVFDTTVFDCAAPTEGIGSDNFSDVARIPLNLLACNPKHYVYCSSSCVYPDGSPSPTPENWGFRGEPEEANRGYGWGKRCGELACIYSGVPYTIVRLPNIYGPSYDWSKPHKHVIPALIEKMLRGDDPIVVWGSGEQTRSFLYEEDCAKRMIELSAEVGTFNVPGEEISIKELVRLLSVVTGFKGKVVYDTSKPEGPRRKALAGVSAVKMPLATGLEKTVKAAMETFVDA